MEVGGWFNGLNAVLPDDCRVMDGMGSSSTCLICEELVVVGVCEYVCRCIGVSLVRRG